MDAIRGVYGKIPRPRTKIAIQPTNINGIMIRTKQNEIKKPIKSIGGKNNSIHLEIFS